MTVPAEPAGPVDGVATLDSLRTFIGRYVILPSDAARDAVALWTVHTWAFAAAERTPYLLVTSPEKRCGKTRLIEVLSALVRSPWQVAATSEAALFRKIDRDRPTLLLDEIDTIFTARRDTESLRGLLNAGNAEGASVARCVGEGANQTVRDFSVFCPKLLAGIDNGRIPDTLRDRSICVALKRRADERLDKWTRREGQRLAAGVRAAVDVWASAHVEALARAAPSLPDLHDRALDAWEPLLAIAEAAGGPWVERATCAAYALTAASNAVETGASVRLLADLAAIFEIRGMPGSVTTTDALDSLCRLEDAPWADWNGVGLTAHGLARLLRGYGVTPGTVRHGKHTAKGYSRAALEDAWRRYLPQPSHRHAPPQSQVTL